MLAYEILAHDKAGLALNGVTDDGYCLWIGTPQQWSEAEYLSMYFEENNQWPY